MSKIDLNDINSGYNRSAINTNFQRIKDFLDDRVLMRNNVSGEPNAVLNDIDFNGKRIYNLPEPALSTEPVRLSDIQELTTTITANLSTVAEKALQAGVSAASAAVSAASSDSALNFANFAIVEALNAKEDAIASAAAAAASLTAINSAITTERTTAATLANKILTTPVINGFSGTGVGSISANSASAALTVTQTGSGNALVVEDVASDSTPFTVDSQGRVAIASSSGITGAALTIGGDSSTGFVDQFRVGTDAGGFSTRYFKTRNANVYANTIVQNGDILGSSQFFGADGTNYVNGASIRGEVDGTPGTNDMPGRLVFSTTADGASSPTERMRIDSAGNVGIGHTTPSSWYGQSPQLVVSKAQNAETVIGFGNATSAALAAVAVWTIGGTGNSFTVDRLVDNNGVPYCTHNAGVALTHRAWLMNGLEKLRLDSAGNLLIKSAAGLGYGTGAGGTVTQATSKSTAVTLNKPTGQITMTSDALASATTIGFVLNNSLITSTDILAMSIAGGGAIGNYNTWAQPSAGTAIIYLRNISTGSLSEGIVINFAIIKGATS